MEVRFLPPERKRDASEPLPFASIARIPEHGDPSTSGRAVGREHEEGPNARRGGARGGQGQTAEVRQRPRSCIPSAAGRRCGTCCRASSPPVRTRSSWSSGTAPTTSGPRCTSWGLKPSPVFVEQTEQLGTGHAVLAAEQAVGRAHDVLVVGGDFDPVTGRRSEATARCASTIQRSGRDLRDRARRAGRLRTRRARTGQAGRDRGGHRRAGGAPRQQPGLAARHGVPSRRPVPRVAGRGSREPQGRVLPERGAPDPHGQGRACVGGPRRHRRDVRRELARRAGRRRARDPPADQRRTSGQRRHDGRPRHDLHRRRRSDRPGHGDPADDVPGGRDGRWQASVDRPVRRGSSTPPSATGAR